LRAALTHSERFSVAAKASRLQLDDARQQPEAGGEESVAQRAGAEPIPGYRLIEPLGSGGFGEVWKCEAPGGLLKAIKFVRGNLRNALENDNAEAQQELQALERVKGIRHPFILSMDRVEVVAGELLIVMELADRSLHDVFQECRQAGLPGIPREELLAFLLEAAEALDWMSLEYGLQHLDIKPRNLFLVSNHVKVADFGLVKDLEELPGSNLVTLGGLTPLYASPEALKGTISQHSDQYSLAIVYQELLTGSTPFSGKNVRQLTLQHLTKPPDLEVLSAEDQPIVARALAKEPQRRYPSCLDLVHALMSGQLDPPPTNKTTWKAGSGSSLWLRRPPKVTGPRTELRLPAPSPTSEPSSLAAAPLTSPELCGPFTETQSFIPLTQDGTQLPGEGVAHFRFLNCIGRTALGEIWEAQAPDGCKQLVKILFGFASTDEQQENARRRLQTLTHPHLTPVQVAEWTPGRLVLLAPPIEQTLYDLMEEYQAAGQSGIPREELLDYLGIAAEALDSLYRQFRLRHLGLHPGTLLLQGGKLQIADFGLIDLLWVPGGQVPAMLKGQYAAPELAKNEPSRSCDVYSLAMIYAELFSGTHPLQGRIRQGRLAARTQGPVCLQRVSGLERLVLLQALSPLPDDRFSSCLEFIEALEAATPDRGPETKRVNDPVEVPPQRVEVVPNPNDLTLPCDPILPESSTPSPVIPETSQPGAVIPAIVSQLALAAVGSAQLHEQDHFRYLLDPGKVLRSCFGALLLPGMTQLKLDLFCQQWQLEVLQTSEDSFRFFAPKSASLWQRFLGRHPGLEVQIDLIPPQPPVTTLTSVTVEIKPVGCRYSQAVDLLEDAGPLLLEDLRACLQASSERRMEERLGCREALRVWPIQDNQQLAPKAIDGYGKDINEQGMGLFLPEVPNTPTILVDLSQIARTSTANVLARIIRTRPDMNGWYEIGVVFCRDEKLTREG
jgi:serine/threonine protein kinase